MSTEVFDRAKAREIHIWGLPQVNLLGVMGFIDKITPILTIMLPLMSNRFMQDFYVIQEKETIKFDQLISLLITELAKIDSDRTVTLLNIVSKRAVKALEFQVRQRKLDVKAFNNLITSELMDAQFDALDVDRAELATLVMRVQTALLKANAEYQELLSRIELEGLNLSLAEVEVLETQIKVARLDIQILEAQLKVLRIGLEVSEVLLEVAGMAAQKITLQADVKSLQADIDQTRISGYQLTSEQAEFAAELDQIIRKLASDLTVIAARRGLIQQEKDDTNEYITAQAALIISSLAAQRIKTVLATSNAATAQANAMTKLGSIVTPEQNQRTTLATQKAGVTGELANMGVWLNNARIVAVSRDAQADIDAATLRAAANVVSTLTHLIGPATTE
jgi:hypothetical protein